MSCKAGNKNHKQRCERYKAEGRRLINKAKKAKKHEKRMQRFVVRKAAGKCYEYSKERTEEKRKKHMVLGSNIGSNRGRHTEFAMWDSVESFLNKDLDRQKREAAKKASASQKEEAI